MRSSSSRSTTTVSRVGVVHVVDLRGAVDVDDIVEVVRAEIIGGRARALVIDVPASTSLSEGDAARISGELDTVGPHGWESSVGADDPGELARIWHVDGREIRIYRL